MDNQVSAISELLMQEPSRLEKMIIPSCQERLGEKSLCLEVSFWEWEY